MRLHVQGVWAFVLAGISTGGVIVGVFQYFILGAVFVRPGHAPVEGRDAIAMILFLSTMSFLLWLCGMFFRARARSLLRALSGRCLSAHLNQRG